MAEKPLRVGIIGLGGYAGYHHTVVKALEGAGACRLVCACDPRADEFGARREELEFDRRGIRVYRDYLEMLDACRGELDMVTIPTPVPLHAAMHRACVERGLPVYLEKPPTLDWAEFEEMLAVEARAARSTNVGFNHLVDPTRLALKQRLVDGDFGEVEKVTVLGLWPRSDAYYARAPWAGRLILDGRLVLDSCLGNAMAHLAHSALFWCGRSLWVWPEIADVAAELYRGNAVEGADTVFVRAETGDGIGVSIAMSHACAGEPRQMERVFCRQAVITYVIESTGHGKRHEVCWQDGRVESGEEPPLDYLAENLRAYLAYLRGQSPRPQTRLVDARPFVQMNCLMYVAAGKIATLPEDALSRTEARDGGTIAAIRGLDEIARRFLEQGEFPCEQGLPWGSRGGRAVPSELGALPFVVRQMADEAGRHACQE